MLGGLPKKQNNKAERSIEKIEKKIEEPVKKYVHFFRMDESRRQKFSEEIKDKAKPDFDFVLLTIFSAIIIALGLIIDNAAVVIGGMIIAPLFWPVLSLSLAVIRGNVRQIRKSIFTILKATLLIFIVSFIVAIISPYLGESRELLLRTKPTLFELFIALAAGFIGAFAVAHPKLSAALAGVVAAVALVPPLAAMGVLFAQGEFILAGGAALLYFTNLIAITLSSVILFMLVGVKFPTRQTSKDVAVSNISWFVIFLIIIAIPLTLVMKGILNENKERGIIREVVEQYTINTKVTSLTIDDEGDVVDINVTLQSPYELTSSHINRLSDILISRLESSVNLQVKVIPTYEVGRSQGLLE
ncbi:TIGR00341 family protein [Patescibacteria group bacterium]|nr:TIGR00341 family protein [Patescibacteria group bacterium]MBU0964540.1 TIGR00341 family protein [Patescibacteria group bacterium]